MKPRFAAALAGVLAALSLSACSGAASTAPAPAYTTYTPPPVVHAARPTHTPDPTPTEPAKPAAPSFTDWIATNYAGVSWASLVTSGSERFGVLWIETSIHPDADAPPVASKICSAGRAYALEAGAPFNGQVSVRASTGLKIGEC